MRRFAGFRENTPGIVGRLISELRVADVICLHNVRRQQPGGLR